MKKPTKGNLIYTGISLAITFWLLLTMVSSVQADEGVMFAHPIADAHVLNTSPNKNYGAYTGGGPYYLHIIGVSASGSAWHTYLKYQLPEEFSSAKYEISDVRLAIVIDSTIGTTDINVHATSPNWNEMTLTWNNKPDFGEKLGQFDNISADLERYTRLTTPIDDFTVTSEDVSFILSVNPEYTDETTEEQTSSDHTNVMYSPYQVKQGQKLRVTNRSITKLGFWLAKMGNPPGEITFKIIKVSDNDVLASKVWGNATDLTEELLYTEIEFDTPVLIYNEEVRMVIEIENGGDVSNWVGIKILENDVKADECLTAYIDNWDDETAYECTYRYKWVGRNTSAVYMLARESGQFGTIEFTYVRIYVVLPQLVSVALLVMLAFCGFGLYRKLHDIHDLDSLICGFEFLLYLCILVIVAVVVAWSFIG